MDTLDAATREQPAHRVWRSTAANAGWPGYPDRNGQTVAVVGPLSLGDADREALGPMYRVRFLDGTETDAFADEIEEEAQ